MSLWFAEYRWLFLTATVGLLGFAFYRAYRQRQRTGPWSLRILYGTTALSLGLIIYSLVTS